MGTHIAIPPETLAAFGGDELRARVYWEKYSLRGPDGRPTEATPQDMWRRVAAGLAAVEPDEQRRARWQREFSWLLDGFRFLPGGRILHAVGQHAVGRKAVPTNCFVIPLKGDSLPDIYECAKEMAVTYSRGGGVGVDVSALRPRGSVCHNAAHESTGAVSFMETFSLVTGTIGMSGRRGALMLTIRDSHPDVLDFVRVKRNTDKVRFANISVLVSDAFMRAVEQDADWRLHFENPEADVYVDRTIKARELWDELIRGARDWAEPGCLFIDTARRLGTTEYNGMQVLTTNPCLRGSVRLLTRRGLMQIADLEGQSVEIYAGDGQWRLARILRTGRKKVYRATLSNGLFIEATADHRIDAGWRELAIADAVGAEVNPFLGNGDWDGEATIDEATAVVFGFLQGDGNFKDDGGITVRFGTPDRECIDFLTRWADSHTVPYTLSDTRLYLHKPIMQYLRPFGFHETCLPDRPLPDGLFTQPPSIVRAFLRGLFSANGAVIVSRDTGRVTLKSTCRRMIEQVQQLAVALGLSAYITSNRPQRIEFSNGTYVTKPSYDLNIPGRWARIFADTIGFIQSYKQDKTARWRRGKYFTHHPARIVTVEEIGEEDVYDFSEPVTHWGWGNGIRTHNCGEQFLDPYNNCCLGSLNLLAVVRQPFADLPPDQNVDWDALHRAVRAGVRFLDNVITYADPLFPLEAQREAARRARRVGLGITGLGDLLAALRLRYDTDEAIAFAGRLMEFIKLAAYRASVALAKEKGAFPAFDAAQHLAQPFFASFPDDLRADIADAGLRNAALLTVPPTGSISAMAGVTSGIEPMFALTYLRRSESLSREYFTVVHPLVETYLRAAGQDIPDLRTTDRPEGILRELLPAFFVTAHEIDPVQRVRMQAAISRHIDNSVSSTINLPRDVSTETVEQVYRLAWQLGCKGITVYREGSREGVLLTSDEARRRHKIVALAETVRATALAAAPDLALDGGAPEEQIESAVRALADRLRGSPVQLQLTAPTEAEPLMRRPQALAGTTYRVPTATGTMFVTINELDGQPVEVFCRLGKGGSHAEADSEMAGRLISLTLRLQAPSSRTERLSLIRDQLEGIGGGDPYGFGPNKVKSIADAIAKAIGWHLDAKRQAAAGSAGEPETLPAPAGAAVPAAERQDDTALAPIAGGSNGNLCPQCHQYSLITDQGCTKCRECSYKEC